MIIERITNEVKQKASEEYVVFCKRMLCANDGYGKMDTIIGCKVPDLRKISQKYYKMAHTEEIVKLLHSEIHEMRLIALMIMILMFEKSDDNMKKELVDIYIKNTQYINNWDLVDLSCYKIIGSYFKESDNVFWKLAYSLSLWDNRIAIVSTYAFIKKNSFDLTIKLAEYFLNHNHHLIHKASGWMLREVGKQDKDILLKFLRKNHNYMPRIMLSYACEKLTVDEKALYYQRHKV